MKDKKLVQQIQQGDRVALDLLIRKYYPDVYNFCFRKIGDAHLAADLTQEVFLKLVQYIDNYVHLGKFKNYLFTIALNTCNDHFRKMYQKNDFVLEGMNPLDIPTDDRQYDQIEQSTIVKRALHSLPDMQKDAVILRFYHDLKVKDIAKITGASLTTTKSRLKQGLDKLKKMLRREDLL